jgi:lipopolysaccharide transport system permease protein
MGVLVGTLSLVFGTLFNSPLREFLPFLMVWINPVDVYFNYA